MTPNPKLWARLEKWLRENKDDTFKMWIVGNEYCIRVDQTGLCIGRTFNAALRRLLKAVGA